MKQSLVLPFWFDRPATEALDIARNAEAAGIDELWIGEMMTFDAFALAAAIAAQTRQLSLIVGPLAVHLRDPAALALGVASVSTIAGRPVHIALGASTPHVVAQWHGRPWTDPIGRMTETVDALRPLLMGERSSFYGRHVHSDGFRIPQAQAGTQIAIAAFAPRMIDLAARAADRVVLNLVTVEQTAHVSRQIAVAAQHAGRPAPPLTVWMVAALDNGLESRQQLVRQLVAYVGAPGYGEMFINADFAEIVALARSGAHPREIAANIPPALIESVAALGSIAAIRERIEAYRSAGAAQVAVVPGTASDAGARRLIAGLTAQS